MSDPVERVLSELKGVFVERGVFADADVSADRGLSELGIDSIELALAFAHFEQRYDAEFENQEIDHARYRSLKDVARAIAGKLPPQ